MANETLIGGYPTDYPQYPPYHNPQVYHLVKDESGESRSFLDRAFISFSYGGVNIEDFGLIATFEDNGKTGNVYANFEDLTSNYSVVDGQFYWGFHYTTDALNFVLATDGMTQKQLDAFKQHFRPGRSLPLILAEHPYRAILARVSQSPTYTLVPFQETEKHIILDTEKVVPVTVYRGTIQLSFVMDMPFWYGTTSYLHKVVAELNQDEIKSIIEDGLVITQPQLIESYFLGNNKLLLTGIKLGTLNADIDNPYNIIASSKYEDIFTAKYIDDSASIEEVSFVPFSGRRTSEGIFLSLKYPINNEYLDNQHYVTFNTSLNYGPSFSDKNIENNSIFYPIEDTVINNTLWRDGQEWHLNIPLGGMIPYPSANEVEHLSLQLNIYKIIDDTMEVISPNNFELIKEITIFPSLIFTEAEGEAHGVLGQLYYAGTAPSKPIIKFTITPQFQTSGLPYIVTPTNSFITETNPYNVLNLTNTATGKVTQFKFSLPGFYQSYNQVIKLMSENWALDWTSRAELLRNSIKDYYIRAQAIKLCEEKVTPLADFCTALQNNIKNSTATFIFNSATGEAIGRFTLEHNNGADTSTIEENVGDMVCGDYLVIEEQNHLINGQISSDDCYQITTDYPGGLQNFTILYNNMYL